VTAEAAAASHHVARHRSHHDTFFPS
jgi:hypothetical protein